MIGFKPSKSLIVARVPLLYPSRSFGFPFTWISLRVEPHRCPSDLHLLESRFSLRGSNGQVDATCFLAVGGGDSDGRGETVAKRFVSAFSLK